LPFTLTLAGSDAAEVVALLKQEAVEVTTPFLKELPCPRDYVREAVATKYGISGS